MSSDSESLMDLSIDTNDGADVMFKFPSAQRPKGGFIKNIEMASEAFDDIFGGGELTPPTTSSERDSIGSSIKRKDLVTFILYYNFINYYQLISFLWGQKVNLNNNTVSSR